MYTYRTYIYFTGTSFTAYEDKYEHTVIVDN
jgi:hypothetical protein